MNRQKIIILAIIALFLSFFRISPVHANNLSAFLNPANLQERVNFTPKNQIKTSVKIEKTKTQKINTIAKETEKITPSPQKNQGIYKIPTIMFHHIDWQPKSEKMRYLLSFPPEKFEQLLKYLDEQNIETLTFHDMKEILDNKRNAPKKGIILSFDDGFYTQYSEALPLLQKYKRKGVFFIITSKIGNDEEYMNWTDIQAIADAGNEIGSHTITHPDLPTLSPALQKREIISSKNILEYHVKKPIVSLSYPYGRYNQNVINTVKNHYLFGRTVDKGYIFDAKKRFSLPIIHSFPEFQIESLGKLYR